MKPTTTKRQEFLDRVNLATQASADHAQRTVLRACLEAHGGNRSAVARQLHISRQALRQRLTRLGLVKTI